LRVKAREAGGQMHVCKNTLLKLALKEAGITLAEPLVDSSLVGFAFQDPPGLAKVLNEACKSDVFAIKGGFLDRKQITIGQVKALAELPPMPVMRAMLLGVVLAPATKLVRTLAEPARHVAAVIKAYSEAEASPETVSSPA
ncbi:MAG: 50S ribosomal protein L10, partial [Anaerolineaceae bacterium]|nr:50S ribosomal protein L10 [Anaerolineaceae bacterium]